MCVQARCQLGNKYGALMEDCAGLLALALRLDIQVVGVAFHVGSGATNPQAFADAIAAARLVGCPFCTSAVLPRLSIFALSDMLFSVSSVLTARSAWKVGQCSQQVSHKCNMVAVVLVHVTRQSLHSDCASKCSDALSHALKQVMVASGAHLVRCIAI